MASLSIPYSDFVAGTTIVSQQVDDNNTAIVNYINARNAGTTNWDAVSTVGALTSTLTSNQLILGTTRTVTLTAPTPASASRIHTIPDITAAGTFAFLEGTQTFSGSKTMSALTATLAANMAAGGFKLTGLGAGSAAGESVRYEQLHLLQVPVFASETTGGTTTNSAFQNIGASAVITPTSTSSKIFGIAAAPVTSSTNAGTVTFGVNGTTSGDIYSTSNSPAKYKQMDASSQGPTVTYFWLDSPASVAAQTYQMRVASDGTRTAAVGNSVYTGAKTIMILFEVI